MALHTIDPELWMDDNFFVLPANVKLLYLGLISVADDQGRVRVHLQLLKSRLFLGDTSTKEDIEAWLNTLHDARFIILYEAEGNRYLQIRDWWQQQANNNPKPSKYPAPSNWRDKTGYVYLIYDGELFKIGRTSQPDKRIAQIEYQGGRPCQILAMIESEDYRNLEFQLHEKFSDKRVRGEWFELDPEDVAWIASLAERR